MKHLLKIALGLFLCLNITTACDDDDDKAAISGFSLSRTEIASNAEGNKETVTVTSEGEWTAKASEPWISISPANGFGTTECTITIDAALKNEVREAEIRFMPKGQNVQTITVTQLGYGKMVHVKETEVKIKASDEMEKRYFEAVVTSNVSFDIKFEWLTEKEGAKLSDWIILDKKNEPEFNLESARPQSYKIRFDWNMNPEWIERQAKINFVPKKDTDKDAETTPILVTQEASPEITDDRAGDSLAILTIRERLRSDVGIDPSESMSYWENVQLWERNDEDLPKKEAIGRVRAVNFTMVNTKESIPQEVKYLKYMETFQVYGNVNTMLLNIELGSEICELEHLKHLQIGGYGLVSLPDDFNRLDKLESLDLSANNFTGVPDVLTPVNFPNLKKLVFNGNRRWTVSNLKESDYDKDKELGFHINMNETPNEIDRLFLWDNLEELVLSYNYLEGTLPTYEDRPGWQEDDLKQYGDTLDYLRDHWEIPRILPNMKRLTLNLNFFTGELPKWLLYHPKLLEWFPEILIFNQQESGFDSKGEPVKFSNAPTNFEYYFTAFPKYENKYAMEGDEENAESEDIKK